MNSEYCIVVDSGLCYATYDQWIRNHFPRYVIDFLYNHSIADIKSNRLYKIIGHAPHDDYPNIELYLIRDMDTEQVFIVEKDGIVITTTATVKNYTTTLRCDKLDTTISCNIEGGERNMNNKIVDLYYERKKKELLDKYEKIINDEYEENEAVKEYTELKNTFETALAEMADRYNQGELRIIVRTGYVGGYPYELNDNIRDEIKKAHREEYNAELKQLDLLVEEVRAMLEFYNTEEYKIDVLKQYGIIDKKGKLNV